MRDLIRRLRHDDRAATAVEYAIIAAIVGVSLIGALVFFREELVNLFRRIAAALGGN
ncbi:MAG: Flp family type IVb pilin [Myxococcales bacterium]|nr:Flp family type IVb pilin [Myxococcales bacterium]